MSLSDSINSLGNKRYGATWKSAQMLRVVSDPTHHRQHVVTPSDTLQGIAIRYGVTVEKLKRVNKLWSNESLHVKERVLIPTSDNHEPLIAMRQTLQCSRGVTDGSTESQPDDDGAPEKEESPGVVFNRLLNRIDTQIQITKNKLPPSLELESSSVPAVNYDSYQQLSPHLSPTRTYSPLEQQT